MKTWKHKKYINKKKSPNVNNFIKIHLNKKLHKCKIKIYFVAIIFQRKQLLIIFSKLCNYAFFLISKIWFLQYEDISGDIVYHEIIPESIRTIGIHMVGENPEDCLEWVLNGI